MAELPASEPQMGSWQKRMMAALVVTLIAIDVAACIMTRSWSFGLVVALVLALPFTYAMIIVRDWHKAPKER
jgi:hypothetical protein